MSDRPFSEMLFPEMVEGDPDLDLVGKPCVYCGKTSEGYFSIHRDGFGEGPEVPLCNQCGGFESPTPEDIWCKISKTKVSKNAVSSSIFSAMFSGRSFVTRDRLIDAWGCDACGVKRHMKIDITLEAKLHGEPCSGVWKIESAHLCDVCKNQRNINTVVREIIEGVFIHRRPIKSQLYRVTDEGRYERLWGGLDQWMQEHNKSSCVTERGKLDLTPDISTRLDRGLHVFGNLEEPED